MPDERLPAIKLWLSTGGGLPRESLQSLILSNEPDCAITSSFKIASAAQTTIGLAALSAAHFHELRTGVEQTVSVNARHAVLEFRSEAYYTLESQAPGALWDTIAGLYRTKDGKFVRLHTNFPHHRLGILSILGLPDSSEIKRNQVQGALMQWDANEFEEKAAESGMCAFALRTFDEWDRHPQGLALRNEPPVTVIKIGDAPRREISSPSSSYKHPLENIKVLDLSRVLAGPVAGRTLAVHGADVLLVTSPKLPALPTLDVDTSRGKRTTQLDLNLAEDKQKLQELIFDADVFLQAYRPGALEDKGFGTLDVVKMKGNRNHGIICANLCAWGWEGPWKHRRGFDSLVQTATGFNAAESQAYAEFQGRLSSASASEPKPFPVQALDHAAGYLMAYGINVALCKTITEGGSWEVRVSLAAVAQWLRSLGRVPPEVGFGQAAKPMPSVSFPPDVEVRKLSSEWAQSFHSSNGTRMTALKHAAILSKTPVKDGNETTAPIILDCSSPEWIIPSPQTELM
ncbi:CoA-transferase family III domain-containing protein [Lentinula boryana]|uniref:CoA-transferase family III domain-containing protein n=1 Tax=Lentinula boryana TaxID=40481 RepID=A0ABQ8QDR6_9AGAR|nr:CoA-transferase family III domain-containing protein [Lentinula boryana]